MNVLALLVARRPGRSNHSAARQENVVADHLRSRLSCSFESGVIRILAFSSVKRLSLRILLASSLLI